MVSISGMTVSLRTDLRFPITGQQGHGSRNIQQAIKIAEKKFRGVKEYAGNGGINKLIGVDGNNETITIDGNVEFDDWTEH